MTKKIKKTTTTVTEEIIDTPPTNERTHIICILDRSGSMADIISDSIGGFNTFLKQQKELSDDATITVVLFDDQYELVYNNVPIKEADELTQNSWYPRGTTALYDAIGKSINNAKSSLNKLKNEKPSKVLVCIVTDGEENASREYKLDDIKNMIKSCEKDNWNFIYLAANQDAFQVGSSFGVSRGNTFTYTASGVGTYNLFSGTLSTATATYRNTSSTDQDFSTKSKNLVNSKDE